jgi:hypothetical protein
MGRRSFLVTSILPCWGEKNLRGAVIQGCRARPPQRRCSAGDPGLARLPLATISHGYAVKRLERLTLAEISQRCQGFGGGTSAEACGAAVSIKPGVERSETPGDRCERYPKPAERPIVESSRLTFGNCDRCRTLRGLDCFWRL